MAELHYLTQGNLALQAVEPEGPQLTVIDGALAHPRSVTGTPYTTPLVRSAAHSKPVAPAKVFALIALVFALVALPVCALASMNDARTATIDSIVYETVSVQAGDSVWSLAQDHGVNGLSTQDVSEVISKANDLSGKILQPGQTVKVPSSVG